MNGRDIVRRAIRFERPDRVPVWYFNRDHLKGDILLRGFGLDVNGESEWGYRWIRLNDGTMGQPADPVVPTWDALDAYAFPRLDPERRLRGVEEFKARAGGRYVLGGLGISGFNLYTFLRGFENAMVDFVAERPQAERFLDRIMGFEMEQTTLAARAGLDGVHFSDDWGSQENLLIPPDLWRDLFKPRYRSQVEHAHALGLDVWFHSCGKISSIIPDMHEIGIDVINISQPNANDIEAVGAGLRGRQCFMVPISYQTVSISGTPSEIRAEAQRLYAALGTESGGLIGYVEEYSCMGMTEENYQACGAAFGALGPADTRSRTKRAGKQTIL